MFIGTKLGCWIISGWIIYWDLAILRVLEIRILNELVSKRYLLDVAYNTQFTYCWLIILSFEKLHTQLLLWLGLLLVGRKAFLILFLLVVYLNFFACGLSARRIRRLLCYQATYWRDFTYEIDISLVFCSPFAWIW